MRSSRRTSSFCRPSRPSRSRPSAPRAWRSTSESAFASPGGTASQYERSCGVPVCFQTTRVRDRVAGELRHPRQGDLVLPVHPVALALVDLDEVLVPVGSSFCSLSSCSPYSLADLVAVVRRVVAADLQGERDVPQRRAATRRSGGRPSSRPRPSGRPSAGRAGTRRRRRPSSPSRTPGPGSRPRARSGLRSAGRTGGRCAASCQRFQVFGRGPRGEVDALVERVQLLLVLATAGR